MNGRVTFLLPVDEAPPAELSLAAGVGSLQGVAIGVIDNQLWRSMPVVTARVLDAFAADGATRGPTQPFDHLSADFPDQQAALAPLAVRVGAVIAGLGN